MKTIVIDTEYAPAPEGEQALFAPEFKPDSRLKQPLPPEEMPVFKHGTLKDPDKIDAWVAGKQGEWAQEQLDRMEALAADVEKQRLKWADKAQLDAMRSRLCAVGVLHEDGQSSLMLGGGGETAMVNFLWNAIDAADKVIAHNIGYDLGMAEQRSMILGIKFHGTRAYNTNFYSDKFVDSMALWSPRAAGGDTPANLDMVGLALGLGKKPGSGKDFWTYDEDKKREYLTHDLTVCMEIARRAGVV